MFATFILVPVYQQGDRGPGGRRSRAEAQKRQPPGLSPGLLGSTAKSSPLDHERGREGGVKELCNVPRQGSGDSRTGCHSETKSRFPAVSTAPNGERSSPERGAPTPGSGWPKGLPWELHIPRIKSKLQLGLRPLMHPSTFLASSWVPHTLQPHPYIRTLDRHQYSKPTSLFSSRSVCTYSSSI